MVLNQFPVTPLSEITGFQFHIAERRCTVSVARRLATCNNQPETCQCGVTFHPIRRCSEFEHLAALRHLRPARLQRNRNPAQDERGFARLQVRDDNVQSSTPSLAATWIQRSMPRPNPHLADGRDSA